MRRTRHTLGGWLKVTALRAREEISGPGMSARGVSGRGMSARGRFSWCAARAAYEAAKVREDSAQLFELRGQTRPQYLAVDAAIDAALAGPKPAVSRRRSA